MERPSRCPLCAGPSEPLFESGAYRVVECRNAGCRHARIDPAPAEEALGALYETAEPSAANSNGLTLYEDYQRDPELVRRRYEKVRLRWLARRLPALMDDPLSVILDVGCSTGMFLRMLKDRGMKRAAGLERSATLAAFVREKHGLPCAARWDEIADFSVDLMTCYDIIEHVSDPVAFLRRARAKLKPGGILILTTPHWDSWYRRLSGRRWLWLMPPAHLHYFTRESLLRALAAAGLAPQILDSCYEGTWLYLLAYHACALLGRPLPSTSRAGGLVKRLALAGAEGLLSLLIAPASLWADRRGRGLQLRALASPNAGA